MEANNTSLVAYLNSQPKPRWQQIGRRRRWAASCTNHVDVNKARFIMEANMEVCVLQASPLLHTSTVHFTGLNGDG